mgnify:CR=1 FL=1
MALPRFPTPSGNHEHPKGRVAQLSGSGKRRRVKIKEFVGGEEKRGRGLGGMEGGERVRALHGSEGG